VIITGRAMFVLDCRMPGRDKPGDHAGVPPSGLIKKPLSLLH
jgi:hypothetical protein